MKYNRNLTKTLQEVSIINYYYTSTMNVLHYFYETHHISLTAFATSQGSLLPLVTRAPLFQNLIKRFQLKVISQQELSEYTNYK